MIDGFKEFEFDLPEALLTSLVAILDGMEGAPLTPANVVDIPEAQGVYQLMLDGQVVYIGKTDSDAGLRKRLERHAFTIDHRTNLSTEQVSFKAVRIFVFTAMDLESQLIKHYNRIAPVQWNNSGFGSNDPGRNRDHTDLKPQGFDALYPIDIDRPVALALDGPVAKATTILSQLGRQLPYTLRIEAAAKPKRAHHLEIQETNVDLEGTEWTTRGIILAVLKALPPGWQATVLAGRIILYKETHEYTWGTVIGRSGE